MNWYTLRIFSLATVLISSSVFATPTFQEELKNLEKSINGYIGISAVNTNNNQRLQYHAQERFPMGCTSKVMGVSAILEKSLHDKNLLQQKIFYKNEDLVNWAPMTKQHLKDGMTIAELSAAAIMQSDNTAMNLLVKNLGSLQKINDFARSIGDHTFRQDRGWPDEALAEPGSLSDSSTPAAMEQSLRRLMLGDALPPAQQSQLKTWMIGNTTGNQQIRAGVPQGWIVGDKTGSGFHYGITNDIGVIWPPKCAPIVLTIYFNQNKKDAPHRKDVLAAATKIILQEFAKKDSCLKLG